MRYSGAERTPCHPRLKFLRSLLKIQMSCTLNSASAAQVSPEEQLAAAEVKWAESKPKVCEFTIRLYFFCRISALSREPIVFRVEGGKPSLVSGESVVADLFRSRAEWISTLALNGSSISSEGS